MDLPFERICLVHYHEIGLKGHNRSSFEKRFVRNLEALLVGRGVTSIRRISGRILISFGPEVGYEEACAAADLVAEVPGCARVSCGFTVERDIELMKEAAVAALSEAGDFETFKVAARRNHTDFAIDSMQMNQLVGAHLCANFPDKGVRMKDPDVKACVEVVQGAAYVYARSIRGVGGLPVGVSGKVVCLLSSGIDSPVALWRMAKRGASCYGLHFSGRPQTAATSEYLVREIAETLGRTGTIAGLYVVPFGDYQRELALAVPPELRVIAYRRLMMRVANALCAKIGAGAVVTGESLGQVASQTLDNIRATDEASELPVLRPLIGTDKIEIIAEAERIGTFETSSQDAPDCCTLFMPRNPETHAKLDAVHEMEAGLDLERWVAELVEMAEKVEL